MSTLDRTQKLRQSLEASGLDAILISQPENRFYLSGFNGSSGFLIVSRDHAFIATDFRYFEQTERQCPDYNLLKMTGGRPLGWFHEALAQIKPKRIGFESSDVSFAFYSAIKRSLSELPSEARPRLMSTRNLVEALREVKDAAEIAEIDKAASYADAALANVVPTISPGMTEKQVAWDLEKAMREAGADSISFDTIVASGPNGALPHHRPSDKQLREGELVVIDMGAKINGYCSDITRTIVVGRPDAQTDKVYHTVLEAQLNAIEEVRAGMTGHDADSLARTVIDNAGYGEHFGHSLGHGIGLAVHEVPVVGPRGGSVLGKNMVFTIEPGIYIPGWGGVRIEDMVVLENGKVRVITQTAKGIDLASN